MPPIWQTRSFIAAASLLLIVTVIGGYRWRVSRIAVRNQELETQVAERTHSLARRTYELEERNREIERRRQELEALYRADAELHRYLSLDQVLQALADIVVDILEADKSALLVWDEARGRLMVRVARGYHPETLPQMEFAPGEGTAGRVLTTGEPVIVADARVDPRVAKRAITVEPEGICAFMQVPI
ncbi:MAG: GAF domain-containing protein, partial [Anaerolineae bacterium]|nr:GAF domain-containing protein [Anaerolineae bacterium]